MQVEGEKFIQIYLAKLLKVVWNPTENIDPFKVYIYL